MMMTALLALAAAAMFTGAAIYVSLAEHPARLGLEDGPALEQWQPSYRRATPMQAGLALAGGVLALWAWWSEGSPLLLAGALLLLANVPFTLIIIYPTNKRLEAIAPADAGPESRALLRRWGRLHAVRSALGLAAMITLLAGMPAAEALPDATKLNPG
jgi:hypothetical protein